MQIITTGLVFIGVAAEAQLIAVGLVLILAAIIDRTGSRRSARKSCLSCSKQGTRPMERFIIVVLAIALRRRCRGPVRPKPSAPASLEQRNSAWTATGKNAARQHYVMISAVTGGPYWIDSKNGL